MINKPINRDGRGVKTSREGNDCEAVYIHA